MKDLHGGNIYRLARERKIEDVIDYSANINPLGIPNTLKEEMNKSWNLFERYPDPDYIELKTELARYNNVNKENIIVGNGATEVIFLYAKALNPKKALIIMPTFAEYGRALERINCELTYFEMKEEEDFKIDRKRLDKELEKNYDLIVLCNPNNPTGKFIKLEEMKKIVETIEKHNTKILIDEAFIDFIEEDVKESIINIENKNVFVVRALTKFFAIPGVRIGFGITFDDQLKKTIENDREPWSVNTLAEICGKTLLKDTFYIDKTKDWIKNEKDYVYEKLSKGKKIKAYKTEVNFILIKLLGNMKSYELRETLIKEGILIRDAANFPFLGENFIRIAIKGRKTNDLVVERVVEITNEDREFLHSRSFT